MRVSGRCPVVAVVGGGFSGTLTAVQLLRRAAPGTRVLLIERSGDFGPGVAYGTPDDRHVLNVPAARMSACADEPDDLVGWAGVAPDAYLPRRVFGEYLRARLAAAAARSAARLERMTGEVRRIRPAPGALELVLDGGRHVACDRAVLALGALPGGGAVRAARRSARGRRPVAAGRAGRRRRRAARRHAGARGPDRLRSDRGRRRADALRRGARGARDAGLAPRAAAVRAPARPARAGAAADPPRRTAPPADAGARAARPRRAGRACRLRLARRGRRPAPARPARCGPRSRTRTGARFRGRREPRVGGPAPPARARGRGRARRACAGPGGCASSAAPSPGSTRGSRCGSRGRRGAARGRRRRLRRRRGATCAPRSRCCAACSPTATRAPMRSGSGCGRRPTARCSTAAAAPTTGSGRSAPCAAASCGRSTAVRELRDQAAIVAAGVCASLAQPADAPVAVPA